MNAMAIGAHGHLGIALGEKLAVHAGLVLRQLVGAQGWVVLAHKRRIGVTAPAKLRHVLAPDLPAEFRGLAHGLHVRLGGITAVAARAREALLRVDVPRKLLFADLKGRVEGSMTIKAGVLRLRTSSAAAQKQR